MSNPAPIKLLYISPAELGPLSHSVEPTGPPYIYRAYIHVSDTVVSYPVGAARDGYPRALLCPSITRQMPSSFSTRCT